MKLAEALIERSDLQKRLSLLEGRLKRSSRVQEGDEPPESPRYLLTELDVLSKSLEDLIRRINRTNVLTAINRESLADLIVRRDGIAKKKGILLNVIESASITPERYSQAEVRYLNTISVPDLQKQFDALAREYRLLDTQIQRQNWITELLE